MSISGTPTDGNAGIIVIVAALIKGEAAQKELATRVREFCQVRAVSSVYKRATLRSRKGSEIVVALKISSDLNEAELIRRIRELRLNEGGANAETILLSLNHEVRMYPGETLPDLRLASDRLFLQCAAEVWGDYEHPILGKTLTELVKLAPTADPIEFFAQGTYL